MHIFTTALKGNTKSTTKAGLQVAIVGVLQRHKTHTNTIKIKKSIESSLVHWVIAEPKAFPELKAMPFVFAHIVPVWLGNHYM